MVHGESGDAASGGSKTLRPLAELVRHYRGGLADGGGLEADGKLQATEFPVVILADQNVARV